MPTIYELLRDNEKAEGFKKAIVARLADVRERPGVSMPLNEFARFIDNAAIKDERFPRFNAVAIRIEQAEFVLSEGPDQHNPQPQQRFYQSTLNNADYPVRVFFAVGQPYDGPGYQAYFIGNNAYSISSSEALSLLVQPLSEREPALHAELLGFFSKVETNLNFSLFREPYLGDWVPNYPVGLSIHFANWPDHGLAELTKEDLLFLLLLAKIQPQLLIHCSAGCGRSATLMLAMYGFLRGLHDLNDQAQIIEQFADLVSLIRSYRSKALYKDEQCLLAMQWVGDLGKIYRENIAMFERIPKIGPVSDKQLFEKFKAKDDERKRASTPTTGYGTLRASCALFALSGSGDYDIIELTPPATPAEQYRSPNLRRSADDDGVH